MRIGITGGGGFIGSHTARMALDMGHQVVVLDRTGDLKGPIGAMLEDGTAALFLGDVRDQSTMMELAAHVDGIIHLAACLGTQETIQNPLPAAETNIFGGLNFLQACAQYSVPGVYIGVGNHFMDNSYSITKTTVERFVSMYNRERGTRVNIVRAVNAYGPGQSVAAPYGSAKVRKITPSFVCRALLGHVVEIYGDGRQISDMVHVTDVAKALVLALEAAADGRYLGTSMVPVPVEVGPKAEDSLSVLQVARLVVEDATAYQASKLDTVGMSQIRHLPMRPGEIAGARVSADTRTLRSIGFNVADLVPVRVGIQQTVRWFAEHWLPEYQVEQERRTQATRSRIGHLLDYVSDNIAREEELNRFPAQHVDLADFPVPAEVLGETPPILRQMQRDMDLHQEAAAVVRDIMRPAASAPEIGPDASVLLPDFTATQAHGDIH